MKIWTVANQKGGVGKTTTAVALGGLLAQKGKRVLLVDTDPHASLTYYFGIDSETLEYTAFDLFTDTGAVGVDEVRQAICKTAIDGISVLPSSMALATLDRKLGARSGMGLVLKRALNLLKHDFDYVLIDVPPVLGVLMVNALAACRRVLIPVQTEFLALKGLERMMRTMSLIQKSQNQEHRYTIIPTMYDKRTRASLLAYDKLRETYREKVWPGMIPVDTKFRDASTAQQPPSYYAPTARGVHAYNALLTYLIQQDRQVEQLR
ncbi:chromosome partitioning protein [Pseudidiomarina planktonica]|uniref:Chromosome partitioning protein n=1 Tax=Pseudidiomarina planktonica TaxID=1323738 RepID=A0A1Y6EIR9_9GAMM|nr:ParA family protein [Pseudidiomarina planktonica]RUO65820.1 ParA family protein [Pseudidiomarina planktonica]SMQ62528.1 chromosome partitioning protein [Pseudidiomarina planktonica]